MRRLARDRGTRLREELCLVEGLRAARECLAACADLTVALTSPRLEQLDSGPEILEAVRALARRGDVEHRETADEILRAACDTRSTQGVALVARRPRHHGIPASAGRPIVVAWEIGDPGNVGTLIRTAHAGGCSALVVARRPGGQAADPFAPRAVRAAVASAFSFAVHEWEGEPDSLLRDLAEAGFRPVACVPSNGVAPEELELGGSVAIVLGSETRGLPSELTRCALLSIPLEAGVQSLNVAATGAAVVLESARQRRAGASSRA